MPHAVLCGILRTECYLQLRQSWKCDKTKSHTCAECCQGHKKTTKLDLSTDILECFEISPNPTKGPLTIKCNNGISFGCYLCNERGQLLAKKESESYETQMDLSSYPTGVYLLNIRQGEKLYKIRSNYKE